MKDNTNPIPLVRDTISNDDLDALADWLGTRPRLTKGTLTVEFEAAWSSWLGRRYSVFVNSGSSANLAMLYALQISGRLKNNKVVVPCVSWVTTVSPVIQLGMEPILCDTDSRNLGVDVEHLEQIFQEHRPSILIIVHVLGFLNDMDEIERLCRKYGVFLLEDSCECVGTTMRGKKGGTFGLAASFSTYYGHHFSTIEGGLISTDQLWLYNLLKSIRSHGWSRDLDEVTRRELQSKYGIDDFRNLYTFYHPGFNLRSTDLQAFLGLRQLEYLDETVAKRNIVFGWYDKMIDIPKGEWKIPFSNEVSLFAYPIIHKHVGTLQEALAEAKVECRPLVCGSIARQPFFLDRYPDTDPADYPFANRVHDYGMYLPCNPSMTKEEVERIAEAVNRVVSK